MSEHESIEWHKGFQMGLYSGISNEQERIIKLLEETGSRLTTEKELPLWIQLSIALIKGENK